MRGGDLAYNPVSLAYGIVGKDTATMYVDAAKVTAEVAAHLAEGGVVSPTTRARRTCRGGG